ncbi:MAG TPA: hypothetical protein EYP68_06985 [Candidatus Korarchaeota archaeon]|nr:hypothetical protein [Candidatus Korarchaeota archaeon]
MEVVETVVALVLAMAIMVAGLLLIYPYIRGKQAEQRLEIGKRIAYSIANGIEGVVSSGVGASSTLSVVLPEEIVVVYGNNSVDIVVMSGPKYESNVTLSNLSITYITLEPAGDKIILSIHVKSGWNLTMSGLASSGRQNYVRIDYYFYNATSNVGYIRINWGG